MDSPLNSAALQEVVGKFQEAMYACVKFNRIRQTLECECRRYLEIPRSELSNPEKMLILREEFEAKHKGCMNLVAQVESVGVRV